MKKANSKPTIAPELLAQLQAVAAMPDDEVNLTDPDTPEVTDWTGAVRGKFYKPIKTLKSIRLDADVLAFFQAQGKGYQTRINQVLRASMMKAGIVMEKHGSMKGGYVMMKGPSKKGQQITATNAPRKTKTSA